MKAIVITVMMLASCTMLRAEEVVRDTFHYATNGGEELYLDRYMLDEPATMPRPCMIFAFGGGFVQGQRDHEHYADYFERLARENIVVVSIDYRLGLKELSAQEGIVAMISAFDNAVSIAVEDMYCATNYVLEHADTWMIDREKIMVSGSSAGAITAVQAEWLRCNGAPLAELLPDDFSYAGVVSCAGAIFSVKGKPKFDSAPAPMLLFHGTSDSNVPYDHASMFGVGFYGSKYIARQLDKHDSPYWFYTAEYVDHSLAATPLIDQCDLIVQFINDFVISAKSLRITTTVESLQGEKQPTRFKVMDYIKTNYAK